MDHSCVAVITAVKIFLFLLKGKREPTHFPVLVHNSQGWATPSPEPGAPTQSQVGGKDPSHGLPRGACREQAGAPASGGGSFHCQPNACCNHSIFECWPKLKGQKSLLLIINLLLMQNLWIKCCAVLIPNGFLLPTKIQGRKKNRGR